MVTHLAGGPLLVTPPGGDARDAWLRGWRTSDPRAQIRRPGFCQDGHGGAGNASELVMKGQIQLIFSGWWV